MSRYIYIPNPQHRPVIRRAPVFSARIAGAPQAYMDSANPPPGFLPMRGRAAAKRQEQHRQKMFRPHPQRSACAPWRYTPTGHRGRAVYQADVIYCLRNTPPAAPSHRFRIWW